MCNCFCYCKLFHYAMLRPNNQNNPKNECNRYIFNFVCQLYKQVNQHKPLFFQRDN